MNQEALTTIRCRVNGKNIELAVPATRTLLELLRRDLSLVASKEGCGKGECGACTILLNGEPVNSCLKVAATLRPEDEIVTLEGLNQDPLMIKVQQAYVDEGAVQCGFCIPGMVISSFALLKKTPHPSRQTIKEFLSGNICRCTGYRKIVAALEKAAGKGA